MRNRKGLTLVEIIIAMALIGIIAVGILPGFSSQFFIMKKAANITTDAFNAQALMEERVYLARQLLRDHDDLTTLSEYSLAENITFLGKNVDLHQLSLPFPNNHAKRLNVYLSQIMSVKETRSQLNVENVQIHVEGVFATEALLSDNPVLTAYHNVNDTGTLFYANLYSWYVSHRGIANPVFPNDYDQIHLLNTTTELNNLLTMVGSNRYIRLVVTPVDIHGRAGNRQISSNHVFLEGEEWRSGIFAWIDKNNDGVFEEMSGDIRLADSENHIIKLLDSSGFDSLESFPNPSNPAEIIDPSGGALFVPMRTLGSTSPVIVQNDHLVKWAVDNDVNIAKSIQVTNNSNIDILSRNGAITLYQDIQLDASGNPVKVAGTIQMANNGPSLNTGKDISLKADRGLIGINNYASLSAENIDMASAGRIYMHQATISATGNLMLDTAINVGTSTDRQININNSTLTIGSGTSIIKSGAGAPISFNDSVVNKVGSSSSIFVVNSGNSHIDFKGGGWDHQVKVRVPDGKTILLESGSSIIDNQGHLDIGNSGLVRFNSPMNNTVQYPFGINLSPVNGSGSENMAELSSINYDSSFGTGNITPVANTWTSLGNLRMRVDKAGGEDGISSISYSLDNGIITITGSADEPNLFVPVTLTVEDPRFRYTGNTSLPIVENQIPFAFTSNEDGDVNIIVGLNGTITSLVHDPIERTVLYGTSLEEARKALGNTVLVNVTYDGGITAITSVPVTWSTNSTPTYNSFITPASYEFASSFEALPPGLTGNLSPPVGRVAIGDVPVLGVQINEDDFILPMTSVKQLSVTITPEYATNQQVNWSSSNPSIATVTSSGVVSAVAPGKATITVTSVDGNHSDSVEVTIHSMVTATLSWQAGQWPNEVGWYIVDLSDNSIIHQENTGQHNSNNTRSRNSFTDNIELHYGRIYQVRAFDDYGDGWNGGRLIISYNSNELFNGTLNNGGQRNRNNNQPIGNGVNIGQFSLN
ncbi:Ig-like domain-containing protein [Anoxynatronum buryatiense]|uniref:Prepilin-type N-terminal cleavage/methylation domain-containing protein n=1 Tax=Anoxynatronum buryatiense TaxID=489973 RepID=A0AA46AIC0_9CLOT|nr:Ig-like domain-containing protein [Anoxynatronum buryatiense]SMP48787.1 prepilin-type N-terminal cleavage/methylation domain-containing protein [Anoxynatronum buryatiense]